MRGQRSVDGPWKSAVGGPLSRRDFVKLAALAATPVPSFLVEAAERVGARSGGAVDGPILVVLQLSGGNDGLNTVIPFEDPAYYNARPTLAVDKGQVLKLEKGGLLGFHPSLEALYGLAQEGQVSVIENVGYPNPNRSHFRSMEIWHTARPRQTEIEEGWLGLAIQQSGLSALDVGNDSPHLALTAEGVQVPAIQNLNWLEFLFSSRATRIRNMLAELTSIRRRGESEFLRGATYATFTQLDRLESVLQQPVLAEYPDSPLGRRFQWVGQLIASGYASRIYYLALDGFDTHSFQREGHAQLLKELSEAVAAFTTHLGTVGKSEEVVLVVFSEFGRRLKENGSRGTDHGAAAPIFIVSAACRGGLIGQPPRLGDLEDGDVRYQIDFRRVYASLLEEVLKTDSRRVLGKKFEPLPLFKRRTAIL